MVTAESLLVLLNGRTVPDNNEEVQSTTYHFNNDNDIFCTKNRYFTSRNHMVLILT